MDSFTPLKIYNGTPECVHQGQPLPINEWNETPPLGSVPFQFFIDVKCMTRGNSPNVYSNWLSLQFC